MGKVPRGHSARQASQKHLTKAAQSLRGFTPGTPKFIKQIAKPDATPKGGK